MRASKDEPPLPTWLKVPVPAIQVLWARAAVVMRLSAVTGAQPLRARCWFVIVTTSDSSVVVATGVRTGREWPAEAAWAGVARATMPTNAAGARVIRARRRRIEE